MLYHMYAMRDQRSELFLPCWPMRDDYSAFAGLAALFANDFDDGERPTFVQQPHDFALFELGSYDDETGRLEPLHLPRLVISCDDVVSLLSNKSDSKNKEVNTNGKDAAT